MKVTADKTVTVTATFTEREAKLLCCLIGAVPAPTAEDLIKRASKYKHWVTSLGENEVIDLTGYLYDGLCDALEGS